MALGLPGANLITGLGGGLLSGVSSLINNRQNIKAQKDAQDREYQYQTQLNEQSQAFNIENMERQNQYSVENWLMQQEYNSPENQLKRIQETGINPNLVMGSSGVTNSTNSSPDTPNSQTPSAGDVSSYSVNLKDPFQVLLDNATRALQTSMQQRMNDVTVDKAAAETEKLWQETLTEMEHRRSVVLSNLSKETENKWLDKTLRREYKKLGKEIAQIQQNLSLFNLNKKSLEINNDVGREKIETLKDERATAKVIRDAHQAQTQYEMWKNNYIREYGVEPPKKAIQAFWNRVYDAWQEGRLGRSPEPNHNDPYDFEIPPLTEQPGRSRIPNYKHHKNYLR